MTSHNEKSGSFHRSLRVSSLLIHGRDSNRAHAAVDNTNSNHRKRRKTIIVFHCAAVIGIKRGSAMTFDN